MARYLKPAAWGRLSMLLGVACFQCLSWTVVTSGLSPGPNDVYLRVVDVGAGLCVIAEIPGNHHLIYDAGHWNGGQCLAAATEIIGSNNVDLLVLSHGDSDHLGDAADILDQFDVDSIAWTGDERESDTWTATNDAIDIEEQAGATILDLQTSTLTPGDIVEIGDATLTYIAGWGSWSDPGPTSAERRNVISIVAKLEYEGRSVLLTGDTIGKRLGDGNSACKDAEARMVSNDGNVPLDADVIVAPHHGGNNGSSRCFIDAVDPIFVIFSAGHEYHHPTRKAARRYLDHGVNLDNMFRTDRGDHEGGWGEWNHQRVQHCHDGRGDDDVEIVIRDNGELEVAYMEQQTGC